MPLPRRTRMVAAVGAVLLLVYLAHLDGQRVGRATVLQIQQQQHQQQQQQQPNHHQAATRPAGVVERREAPAAHAGGAAHAPDGAASAAQQPAAQHQHVAPQHVAAPANQAAANQAAATTARSAVAADEPPKPCNSYSRSRYLERIERLLPQKELLMPDEVRAVQAAITSFHIPKPVTIGLHAAYIPLALRDSKSAISFCNNCHVKLVKDNPGTAFDVDMDLSCPSSRGHVPKDQPLVCGCGEAMTGSGAKYWHSGKAACDYSATFKMDDFFANTYAHLHFSHPRWNVTSVADEMEMMMRGTPIEKREKAVMAVLHSNCGGSSGRGRILGGMVQSGKAPIDRYGSCWNNRSPKEFEPDREHWYWHDSQGNRDTTKTDILSRYKFAASMENTFDDDYVTEKRYEALVAGAVPIVFRKPNSEKFLPAEKSAIFPEDFGEDPVKLAEHLAFLDTHEEEYQKYHAWKKQGMRRDFIKWLFQSTDFLACNVCEHFANCAK